MRLNRSAASEVSKCRFRSYRLGLALAVVVVLGTACSSAETAASSGGTTANNPASAMIKIGEISDLTGPTTFPTGVPGVQAAIAAVNKAGGINGHHLTLVVCDTQGNPNVATECANEMVSDHVLYVESDSVQGDSFFPVLRSSGIPVTTGGQTGTDASTYPNSYILGSGNASTGGAGAMCAKLGSTKIGIAQLDIAGLTPTVSAIYKTIAPFGLSEANTSITLIPPTAVDMSTYAAALIQKSTCVVEVLTPNEDVPLAAAIHSQDPSIPIVSTGAPTVAQWETIGKLADNVCDNAPTPPAGLTGAPGMPQYIAEMGAYNKSAVLDIHALAGWASIHLAAKLLAHVADPTAATYMRTLNTVGTINLPPLPPLNFAKPTSLISGITRLFSNDVVYFHHVNGGEEAPLYGGQYVDVTSLKSEPSVPTAPHC